MFQQKKKIVTKGIPVRKKGSSFEYKPDQALLLRVFNYSYEEIGKKLGISPTEAYRYVTGKLRDFTFDFKIAVREVLYLELERLDEMQKALWEKVKNGEEKAIVASIKIMERRAKLLGLDAPEKIETETSIKTYVGISLDEWEKHAKKQAQLESPTIQEKLNEELEMDEKKDF